MGSVHHGGGSTWQSPQNMEDQEADSASELARAAWKSFKALSSDLLPPARHLSKISQPPKFSAASWRTNTQSKGL